MIILLAQYSVKEGQTEKVLELLTEMAAKVQQREPDCHAFQISVHRERPNDLLLYEKYSNQAAVDYHRQTQHFKELIVGQVMPLLENRTVNFYTLAIA